MARTFRWVAVLLGVALVVAVVVRRRGRPDHEKPAAPSTPSDSDRRIDEEIDESFPASDAPSHWAGGVD